MTYLVERLAELRRHVAHLRDIRGRATDRTALEPIERFIEIVARAERTE